MIDVDGWCRLVNETPASYPSSQIASSVAWRRYGLGLHLHATDDAIWLEGYDAGVSFTSLHQPSTSITYTVISNWSEGAWPIIELLGERRRQMAS